MSRFPKHSRNMTCSPQLFVTSSFKASFQDLLSQLPVATSSQNLFSGAPLTTSFKTSCELLPSHDHRSEDRAHDRPHPFLHVTANTFETRRNCNRGPSPLKRAQSGTNLHTFGAQAGGSQPCRQAIPLRPEFGHLHAGTHNPQKSPEKTTLQL